MIRVADLYRKYPDEFIATLRGFGISWAEFGDSIGSGTVEAARAWAEVAAVVRVAAADTSTYLGAAAAEWAYPASFPELIATSAHLGEKARKYLPWGMSEVLKERAAHQSSPDEVRAARELLSRVSAFRGLDGFQG